MADSNEPKEKATDSDGNISTTKNTEDKELDDLLDSALEDFDNLPVNVPPTSEPQARLDPNSFGDGLWSNEFLQASGECEDIFKNLVGNDPEAMEELKKIVSAAGKMTSESGEQDFFSNLAASAQNLAADNRTIPSEEELNKLFSSLGLPSASESGDDAVGEVPALVQNMMQMLLSKELLYPAIKGVTEKYPGWLSENKSALQTQQFETYNRQCELMKQICTDFEQESEEDSESVKKERFQQRFEIMKKIQECGHPPASLVGDGNFGLDFDDAGSSLMPNLNMDKCNMQ